MRKYTKADLDNFNRIDNYIICPSGDYSEIREFRVNNGMLYTFDCCCIFADETVFCGGFHFGNYCRFGNNCYFGMNSRFGDNCTFGQNCLFGGHSNFSKKCKFGNYCQFCSECIFWILCEFGEMCVCESNNIDRKSVV